ncbi:cytochrome P450 [Coprinopsis marcescibilis]|uniref:Cytochrome P450 n=1 Tax=Coprinopsis marcescibilis TaxID=230819 RepID=A0A5C3LAP6_COPMA|nr:cytochrome P450 [Coprinopsis marcescibilis]
METIQFIFTALAAVWLFNWAIKRRFQLPLPPGPKGLPLVGNLFEMPRDFPWEKYHEWCKEYNTDTLHLYAAGKHIIVLDSPQAAADLLDKRSLIYSGRPRLPMIKELMGWDWFFGFRNYDETCRLHRKLINQAFNPTAVNQFIPQIKRATRNMLGLFLEDPEKLEGNLRRMAGETIMSVSYGIKIQKNDDFYVKTAEQGVSPALHIVGNPGAFLVDTIPILKYVPSWFPGAGFKTKAKEWKRLSKVMLEVPFKAAKAAIADGSASISLVSANLDRLEALGQNDSAQEQAVKEVAGGLYAVGIDTTVSPIVSCILALVKNPAVLKRAQAELDSVIEPGRFPDLSDEPALPYITAIVHESFRWRDVSPQALPHCLIKEDEYNGYRIPAGSIVIANSWALLHNEDIYPDPFAFNPDRFMKEGKLDFQSQRDPSFACWGYGRRKCPGRYMAYPAVWLAITHLLYCFDIMRAKDEYGNDIDPPEEFISALTIMAKPFKYDLKPRSEDIEKLIQQGLSAEVDFREFDGDH